MERRPEMFGGFNSPEQEKPKSKLDLAAEKAEKVLSVDQMNPMDFIDLYGPDMVEADLVEAKRLEEIYEKTNSPEVKKLSTILEAIVHEQIELSDWFGPEASTIRPTAFDDYKNGIDEIVEFREEESASYLGLAIDATVTADTEKKLRRIKDEIDRGVLAKIKYFKSEHMNVRGERSKVPRVVVEVHRATVNKLMELWTKGGKKDLANHPVQIQILTQIYIQLEAFEVYAEHKGQDELARIYRKEKEIVGDVLNSKEDLRKRLNYAAVDLDDGSTFNLQQNLKLVFTELEF